MRLRARATAALIVLSVTLTACSQSGPWGDADSTGAPVAESSRTDAAPDQPADRSGSDADAVGALREVPFTDRNVEAFVETVRSAGVEVVDDWASPATSPVTITAWQAENMAAEAANGGGITGRTLAEFAPTGPGVPPTPFLVAAWMIDASTPGARFARALYRGRDLADPYDLRFPDAVLALFLADATSTTEERPSSAGGSVNPASFGGTVRLMSAVRPIGVLDAPCSTASSFVQRAIAAVAEALTITRTSGGFFGFLAGIWNTAVALAAKFVSNLITTLTAPIVAQLVGVLNAVAAVEQVSSVLIAWRAPLTGTPPSTRLGIDDEAVTGVVTLQLQPHVLPLPAAVKDCAQSVGVDLTASAAGSRVDWTTTPQPRPDLASTLAKDAALDAEEAASLRYQTGTEPNDTLDSPSRTGTFSVSTTIRRNDVERARRLIAQLLLAQVPTSLRSLVESLARPILDAATAKLAELTDVHSQTSIPVMYHDAEVRCSTSRIAAGTYRGTIDTDLVNGAARGHMTGTVTIEVGSDQRITGQLIVETETTAPQLEITVRSTERVRVSGTTKTPVATLEQRIIDGKDATVSQTRATSAMKGLCPPGLTWDTAPLSPGTRVPKAGTLIITAERVS